MTSPRNARGVLAAVGAVAALLAVPSTVLAASVCEAEFDANAKNAAAIAQPVAAVAVDGAPPSAAPPLADIDVAVMLAAEERPVTPTGWDAYTLDDFREVSKRLNNIAGSAAQAVAKSSGNIAVREKAKVLSGLAQCMRHFVAAGEAYAEATSARKEAESQASQARAAKTVDAAKSAATRASDAAVRARAAANRFPGDKDLGAIAQAAEVSAEHAAESAAQKERWSQSLCGLGSDGGKLSMCMVYGLFAATLSRVSAFEKRELDGGRTQKRLASIAVPFAALRFVPLPSKYGFVSVDIGGYSAFLTKNLGSTAPSVDRLSCARNGGEFESKLPCEANAELYAYAAFYAGITVGKDGIGYISVVPFTAGLAQVGTNRDLRGFYGVMLGLLQISGRF